MANDEELILQIKAGDESKLLDLWEQMRRLAYKQALRLVRALGDDRTTADLDDLMQAAFLAVVDAVEQYDPASGWAFWVCYCMHSERVSRPCSSRNALNGEMAGPMSRSP